METKIYCLKSLGRNDFYVGHLKDGTQAFMSIDFPNLIAVLFNHEGKYLASMTKELSQQTQDFIKDVFARKIWDFSAKDWDELDQWADELGFIQGKISVQKFCLPEYELRIQDLPEVYQDIFDSGCELDEEIKEQIREWQATNDYVLIWGKEYDIDHEGEVIST